MEDNLADVFTKNVKESLNEKLTESYMDKRGENANAEITE